MAIRIKEIAFVFHPVSDLARAREFYEKLLGLKTGFQIEYQPGSWWIEYEIAGTALAISNAFGTPSAGGAGLTLEVEDLDEALASVRAANVPITLELQDFAPCRMFIVASPDGHSIAFHKRKA